MNILFRLLSLLYIIIHNCFKYLFNNNNNNTMFTRLFIDYLRFKDNDRQYKEPLTTIDDYNNQTTSGITVKVFIGAFVVFFTNSFASGYNIGVVNLPEQVSVSVFSFSIIFFSFAYENFFQTFFFSCFYVFFFSKDF